MAVGTIRGENPPLVCMQKIRARCCLQKNRKNLLSAAVDCAKICAVIFDKVVQCTKAHQLLGVPTVFSKNYGTNFRIQNNVTITGDEISICSSSLDNVKPQILFAKFTCQFATAVCKWAYLCFSENEAWSRWLPEKNTVISSHYGRAAHC